MSRRLLQGQVAPRQYIPDGLYPAFNDAYFGLYLNTGSNNAYFGVLNEMQLIRFTVVSTVVIKGIECQVNTAGGGSAVVRMGLYGSTDFGAPGSLIVDAGTVSVTSTGKKAVVISQTLLPGAYYVALVAQDWTGTRPDFRGVVDSVNDRYQPIPGPQDWASTNGFGYHSVAVTGVSGALPSIAGALATVTQGRRTPHVALQISV